MVSASCETMVQSRSDSSVVKNAPKGTTQTTGGFLGARTAPVRSLIITLMIAPEIADSLVQKRAIISANKQ